MRIYFRIGGVLAGCWKTEFFTYFHGLRYGSLTGDMDANTMSQVSLQKNEVDLSLTVVEVPAGVI